MKSKLFTDLKLNFCIPTASLLLLASFDASAQSAAELDNRIKQSEKQAQQLSARVSGITMTVDTLNNKLKSELQKRDAQIKQLQDAMGRLEAQTKAQAKKPDTGQKGDPVTKQSAPTAPAAQAPKQIGNDKIK